MHLNLSQFKKVSDDKHVSVLKHPDGHTISVSKKSLTPKMMNELSALPMHYDVGGAVQDGSQQDPKQNQPTIVINNGPQPMQGPPAPEQIPPELAAKRGIYNQYATNDFGPGQDLSKWGPMVFGPNGEPPSNFNPDLWQKAQKDYEKKSAMEAESKKMAEQDAYAKAVKENEARQSAGLSPINMPPQPQMPGQPSVVPEVLPAAGPADIPQQQPQPDIFGTQAFSDVYGPGLQLKAQGIQEEGNALQRQNNAMVGGYQKAIDQQTQERNSYQQQHNYLTNLRQGMEKDIQAQHIDPERYVNSMTTGSKVKTVLGLLLGGMSQGLIGGDNPALSILNQHINNDIAAQQKELGKKENLLSANLADLGDLRQAAEMTRVMTGDIIANQLKVMAAKTNNPVIKARVDQQLGDFYMQQAQTMAMLAKQRAASSISKGGAGQIDPSVMVRVLVPEHQQNEAYKELGEAQERVKARDNALRAFDQLANVNTLGNRIMSPIQTLRKVNSTRNILAVSIARGVAGRVNEYEFDAAKDLYPAPGDSPETLKLKKQNLVNLVQEKMSTPILNSYGINMGGNVSPQNRYNPQGEKKIQLGPPVK